MFRSVLGFAVFAVLAWLGLKLVFSVLGGLIGLAMTVLWLAAAAPGEARRPQASARIRPAQRLGRVQRVRGPAPLRIQHHRLPCHFRIASGVPAAVAMPLGARRRVRVTHAVASAAAIRSAR